MTDRERADQAERLLAYADRLLAFYMGREQPSAQPKELDTSDIVDVEQIKRDACNAMLDLVETVLLENGESGALKTLRANVRRC